MNLNDPNDPRIIKAQQLGWTVVKWVYDDTYGGIYLGGINPQTNKWQEIPQSIINDPPINNNKEDQHD